MVLRFTYVCLLTLCSQLTYLPNCFADSSPVFAEKDGFVAVEAEHFVNQSLKEVRQFYLTTAEATPSIQPDGDPNHVAGASGGAYLEILPDTRRTHADKLIRGENFSPDPGKMAVLEYKVHFETPGRYYVWVRAYSTGSEDNGLHVGLDGTWPASGQRMQWCEGKRTWRWDSKQRTEANHCGEPHKIYLDIEKPGLHTIHFSMREDGFEFDKWIMTTDRDFVRPSGVGPKSELHAGQMPASFAYVEPTQATPASTVQPTPASKTLRLSATDFDLQGSEFYLDKGKWLAINPEQHKQGSIQIPFPYPSGKYHVTLNAVGEEDGQSKYEFTINDSKVGSFTAPLSKQQFEAGKKYSKTWQNVEVGSGDVLTILAQVGSLDGQEYSRARVAGLKFAPADKQTQTDVAQILKTMPAKEVKVPAGPPLVQPRAADGSGAVELSGELKQWHKVTLTLDGPFANERDRELNPFTDRAFNVEFTHESGSPKYNIPGYFAADGNAAESSADHGTKWRAHLSPDKPGTWNYTISFQQGKHAAIGGKAKDLAPYHGLKGSFKVAVTDKTGRDFRSQGRLQYVDGHYLRFAGSGNYFLKAGPDAPETLLAYKDFDNTRTNNAKKGPLKTWEPHLQDWQPGDPTWKNGKGKGLIGALNYLASKGVNSFSFLPYNAGGDGDNIWPFVERNAKLNYDCSKLDQWGIVFDHATANGLYLHFKMQENEMDDQRRGLGEKSGNIPEALDGGKLGVERKLYCRELIARYGHQLALNWNIGEENTQSPDEVRDMVRYIDETDPYGHNIVIHTYPSQQDKVYPPLLGKGSLLTGASLQNPWDKVHQRTLQWINESAKAGRPWVVANDEQNPASDGVPADPGYEGSDGFGTQNGKKYTMHDIRKQTLWGNLMAGGAGVEYYFGYKLPQNDLICEDFRSRDRSWDFCRIALEFFSENKIPFWEMRNANALIGNSANGNSKYCLAETGEVYLVYLPSGGTTSLDLSGVNGLFTVEWFNPREGGNLQSGSVKSINGGGKLDIGQPPQDQIEDWLAVIRRK